MKEYCPNGDLIDGLNVCVDTVAQTMVKALRQCGGEVSSACAMKEDATLSFAPEMLLPGVDIKTSATDVYPIKKMYLQKFDGEVWRLFGNVQSANRDRGVRRRRRLTPSTASPPPDRAAPCLPQTTARSPPAARRPAS